MIISKVKFKHTNKSQINYHLTRDYSHLIIVLITDHTLRSTMPIPEFISKLLGRGGACGELDFHMCSDMTTIYGMKDLCELKV